MVVYHSRIINNISLTYAFQFFIVDVLQQITRTLGAVYWKFNSDSCVVEMFGVAEKSPRGSETNIDCDCSIENSTFCHVVRMYNPLILFLNIDYWLGLLSVWCHILFRLNFYNQRHYDSSTYPKWSSLHLCMSH